MATKNGDPPRQQKYQKVSTSDGESSLSKDSAACMIEIVAPSKLPEGYKFQAQIDGQNIVDVEVPKGGVDEGQRFRVRPRLLTAKIKPSSIPIGHWKDGCFNCFGYGCCHPQVCLTIWCHLFALGQVMTRLNLNWCGYPTTTTEASGTYKKIVCLVFGYSILESVFGYFAATSFRVRHDKYGNVQMEGVWESRFFSLLRFVLWVVAIVYSIVAVMNTRRHIRQKYAIQETECKGCEDCCAACFCHICAIGQMARHTADFDSYPGACCTENGLPEGVLSPVQEEV